MKLGEGGEAFFVFETSDEIPESLQTSPIVSPAVSPHGIIHDATSSSTLQEPEFLDITTEEGGNRSIRPVQGPRPVITQDRRAQSESGMLCMNLLGQPLYSHRKAISHPCRYLQTIITTDF